MTNTSAKAREAASRGDFTTAEREYRAALREPSYTDTARLRSIMGTVVLYIEADRSGAPAP